MKQSDARSLFQELGNPLLIVLSGPSGVGKDAVLTRIKESGFPLQHVVTATTRPMRPGEKSDVDYHFISAEEFQTMVERKELLEWAKVYGNSYGVPRKPVEQALAAGKDVVVKVDVQGAATIRRVMPQAVLVFLTAESVEELGNRLRGRSTESAADLAVRNHIAGDELKQLSLFDYVVINKRGEIDQAVVDIKAIIRAEKLRVKPGNC